MHVKDLIALIPEQELEVFAAETKVDHQVKKLSGKIIFQLILFSMVSRKRISLRVMEEFLRSASFKIFSGSPDIDAKYNSLSVRIAMINADFFEKIFHSCYDKFSEYLKEKNRIIKYDSTMVAVSSKLFRMGMKVGPHSKTDKKQLKFTIGSRGSLPVYFKIFKSQEALAEDIALKEAILDDANSREEIVVFDRGLKDKKTFDTFSARHIKFVTRTNPRITHIKLQSLPIENKPSDASVTVQEDSIIRLRYKYSNKTAPLYRLVKAIIDTTGEEIFFLSNCKELTAYEIAAIYKSRWQIEIFFKFLKQELNLEHCVSRDINGIRVMMYMTLITAILIIAFKKLNNLSSYKIAKLRLALELDSIMIEQIILLCGGNPQKFKILANDS
ncbi:MAG: IS4 family transposase [Bacteroidia bacterium]|nr:IS4 family transposase [Bacteroidia bacterium]